MKNLEEVDPELIDQAIRRIVAGRRAPDREVAIATHLSGSAELKEWIEMLADTAPNLAQEFQLSLPDAMRSLLYTALAVGLEVGYELAQKPQ